MEVQRVASAIQSKCVEYLDGHIVIGFVADTGQGIIIAKAGDAKTALALNALLSSLVAAGGVSYNEPIGE